MKTSTTVRIIESDIERMFKNAGLQRDSASWTDYERGKGLISTLPDYDGNLKTLIHYLGL